MCRFMVNLMHVDSIPLLKTENSVLYKTVNVEMIKGCASHDGFDYTGFSEIT